MTERHANRICDSVTIGFYLYEPEDGQTTVHIIGMDGMPCTRRFSPTVERNGELVCERRHGASKGSIVFADSERGCNDFNGCNVTCSRLPSLTNRALEYIALQCFSPVNILCIATLENTRTDSIPVIFNFELWSSFFESR